MLVFCTGLAMLFIITITMAGLSLSYCMHWKRIRGGHSQVGNTIPIAMAVGLYHRKTGNLEAGYYRWLRIDHGWCIRRTAYCRYATRGLFNIICKDIIYSLPIYAFFAAALPVWLLLAPRDYLSSFLKIGVFLALILGIFIVNPAIQMPAFTEFVGGGGPVMNGSGLAVHLDYDCLWGNFWFPRIRRFWYDAQR